MTITVGTDVFISEADADTYHANLGNTAWASLSSANKEIALRKATNYMVQVYTGRWAGYITSEAQALPWPRGGVVTSDGVLISSTSIPTAIANVCAELALTASTTALLTNVNGIEGALKRKKVDVLEKEYFEGASTQVDYVQVNYMLRDYLLSYGIQGDMIR